MNARCPAASDHGPLTKRVTSGSRSMARQSSVSANLRGRMIRRLVWKVGRITNMAVGAPALTLTLYRACRIGGRSGEARIAPSERRLQPVAFCDSLEFLALRRLQGLDLDVGIETHVESGKHSHHLETAIDRPLCHGDFDPVVRCDLAGHRKRAIHLVARRHH